MARKRGPEMNYYVHDRRPARAGDCNLSESCFAVASFPCGAPDERAMTDSAFEVFLTDDVLNRPGAMSRRPPGFVPSGDARKQWATAAVEGILKTRGTRDGETLQRALAGVDVNGMAPVQLGRTVAMLSLLQIACIFNHAECVRVLLEAGALPLPGVLSLCLQEESVLPGWHRPPLFGIARQLIGARADVNAQPGDGTTFLTTFAQEGLADRVRFLLEHAAAPNRYKTNGVGPLFKAAQEGHIDCARLLLGAKADPNKRSIQSGATPLLLAAGSGHARISRLLIEAGADRTIAADNGDTPLQMVTTEQRPGWREVAELLRSYEPIATGRLAADSLLCHTAGDAVTLVDLKAKPELK